MDDEELSALKDMKEKLLKEANILLQKLRKQEENNQQNVTLELLPDTMNNHVYVKEQLSVKNEHQLHELSRQVSGITFNDTDREWLRDNIYKYKTCLTTKFLKLFVELVVELEGETEYEIYDITCHFVDIHKCYVLEMHPWVQIMTRRNNFSFLTSAISQYTEQSIDREKIVKRLRSKTYINCNECTDGNGGLLIFLHAPKDAELTYLILQWSLIFSEQTWQIEHNFEIKANEAGSAFEEENRKLLSMFHKPSITKEALVELWTKLCLAVDTYRAKGGSGMDGSDLQ